MCQDHVAEVAARVQASFESLLGDISVIPFGSPALFPFGWRRAAKGRSVWRLVEEVVGQNLEAHAARHGLTSAAPAPTEVGVWDLQLQLPGTGVQPLVNIKTATKTARESSSDVSKAGRLRELFVEQPSAVLLLATIELSFTPDMTVVLERAIVTPTAWLSPLAVRGGTNGNVQCSATRNPQAAVRRSVAEFLAVIA